MSELYHYGVLGMKWGIHRSKEVRNVRNAYKQQKKGAKTEPERARVEAKYKKAKSEASVKAANRLYSKNSKAMNKRIATMSAGETAAQTMLMSSYGAMKYNKARTEGKSVGKSFAISYVKSVGNNATMGIAGLAEYGQNRALRR